MLDTEIYDLNIGKQIRNMNFTISLVQILSFFIHPLGKAKNGVLVHFRKLSDVYKST